MKYLSTFSYLLFTLLLFPLQENLTQELPYNEGTVWEVSFIRTTTGMNNEYLRNLGANWRQNCEEAKKQGLIISYKILSGYAANQEDWDLMLMIEYQNMAALDGANEKWESISAKMIGSQEVQKDGYTKRAEMREIFGWKIVREIVLK
jgi:hypothetical protein